MRSRSGRPTVGVTGFAYAVTMRDEDLDDGTVSSEPKIRVMADDELTPAARAALYRRSDDELRLLAERATRRE